MSEDNICILIIEDNPKSLQQILKTLQENTAVTNIVTAEDTDLAFLKLINMSPDIILLEYPPKGKTANELIELIKTRFPETILAFISDSKAHAVTAIQKGIYDYILKPVKKESINKLVQKGIEIKYSNIQQRLAQAIENKHSDSRMHFQTVKGYVLFNPEELIFCKSADSLTELYFVGEKTVSSYFSLMKFEEMLSFSGFMRVSRTHIINPHFIRRISKNTITLSSNGTEYEIKAGKNNIKKLSILEI
jgi:two-component system, LytTR family, response regulator